MRTPRNIVLDHDNISLPSAAWILYSIRLPTLVCDFFEVTGTIGEGSGESLNRLPVGRHELILADAGYCSVAGIEYVWQHGADVLVRVNPQSFVAYSADGRRFSLLPRLRTLSKVGQFVNGGFFFMVKARRLRAGCVQYERATARFNRLIGDY
jgi:hypothetical protein